MMMIKQADYLKSAVYEKDYPEELGNTEFAFVGRSNVGKSSLINSITTRTKLARVSKTPGRTQLINYFLINNEFFIVDLPGYGFAKVPKAMKAEWGKTIERYLASKRKKLVFVLLDIRRVPSGEDMDMLRWLDHFNVPFKIIFTKMDKVSNNEKFKCMKAIRTKLEFHNDDVFFHSSLKNTGKQNILDFMGDILEEGRAEAEEFRARRAAELAAEAAEAERLEKEKK